MRIAYFSNPHRTTQATGGNAHVGAFIAQAVRAGHEIWTSLPDDRGDTHCLPRNRLARLLALRGMDVVYLRLEWQPRSQCRLSAPAWKRVIGRPVIAWEFNTVPEMGGISGHADEQIQDSIQTLRRYGAGCDVAFCVSRAIRDYVTSTLGIRNAKVVPNGSHPEMFRPDVPSQPGLRRDPADLNVVWIGSAYLSWHDFDTLHAAADILQRRGRDTIRFHLIGPGSQNLTGLPPAVTAHGPKRYDELPAWLSAMDVGLCLYRPGPSDYCSPLKLFDYMASGLTVVGTGVSQVREVFAELDQPDLIVPYENPEALADVLERLADDPERRRRQGRAGRALVIDRYTWARAARDTFDELQNLLEPEHG